MFREFNEFTEFTEIKKPEHIECKAMRQSNETDFLKRTLSTARGKTPEQLMLEAEEWKAKNPEKVRALKEALLKKD